MGMKIYPKVYTIRPRNKNEWQVTSTKKNISLHTSLKWVLVLAQCFGQMPVIGITDPDSRFLKFSWKSWRTLYCLLNCFGSGFCSGFFLWRIINGGTNLLDFSILVFHFTNFWVTIFFLRLAMKWPRLMQEWSSMEFSMRSYGWPRYLHIRIAIMTTLMLTTATIETLMTKLGQVSDSIKCAKSRDHHVFEYYSKVYLAPIMFSVFDYALWKAILLQIENIVTTFAWSFNDLFLMLISTALALRFKQITNRLLLLQKNSKTNNVDVWREMREDYSKLSRLTSNLDEALSYITMTSFASNLYFILMQLFNSLRKMEETVEKVYFFFSFGFVILRMLGVCLYGAWIHDESNEPIASLQSVSTEVYNIEVVIFKSQVALNMTAFITLVHLSVKFTNVIVSNHSIKRFIEQIKFNTVALTGKKFFYVTRGLVLSIAGAIVTYELVLIQFNGNLLKENANKTKSSANGC